MAIAFASVQTATGSGTSVTITKPVSLAAGDVMVAHIAIDDDGGVGDILTPTGWTLVKSVIETTDDTAFKLFMKVATSSDVAASDFTFSLNSQSHSYTGSIARITGSGFTYQVDDGESESNASATFSGGVTPNVANTLLMFYVVTGASTAASVSNYAITTDNPTWTERFQLDETSGGDITTAMATASRTATSATGDFTATIGTTADATGVLIAIDPTINVSVSPSVVSLSASVQSPTISGNANIAVSNPLTVTTSVNSIAVATTDGAWSNNAKSSPATFTNTAKS